MPALAETRVTRIWLGLESETSDALPMIGPVPGVDEAYVIGCVHSGYTSGPFMGLLLAQRILGQEPEMPLFDPARLSAPQPNSTMGSLRMIPAVARPFRGIYVATLTPFGADGRIDEERLSAHFADTTAEPGIVGVLCNGHAGENFLLSRAERRRVTEIASATIGRNKIVVSGILCEASVEAAEHACDAAAAGADAVLVFPPFSWALSQDDSIAVTHHRIVAKATRLPMMLYQAGVASGSLAYRPEVLAELVRLPEVVGIKEGSWESAAYDRNRRLVAEVAPHVEMMASGDEHLLSCFVVGSAGSLVSLAAIMPREIVELDEAVRQNAMDRARALHERIQPLATAIYGRTPTGYATARLKACLQILGRWPNGAPRLPIAPLPAGETAALRRALVDAGLLGAS